MLTKPPSSVPSWREACLLYTRKPVLVMLLLGFSAGLPYLLVFSTLSAWLKDYDVSRTSIGFFSWVGLTYSIKVFWAPIIDRLPLPALTRWLGLRRSWLLLAQCGIMLSLCMMVRFDPGSQLYWIAICALVVAFFSATQDIVIDAFRIESAEETLQGAMSATYLLGYRLALLFSGAGALFLAEFYSWMLSYSIMALSMMVGIMTTLFVSEPARELLRGHEFSKFDSAYFYSLFIAPIVDFFQRNGTFALAILFFISVYRLSDITMGIMANPFYLDMGFSKTEIASVGKVFGFAMTIVGSFLGGIFVVKFGLHLPLILGAVGVAVTNVFFVILANVGADMPWLIATITADNLFGGFAGASFIAYLSSLTNRAYTATQYALFSSLMTLPGKFISGFSGLIVDGVGYSAFFTYAACMGLPAIVMAVWLYMRASR